LIISIAPGGGAQGKEVNPSLPESPEEQAAETYAAYQAGASVVHVHARLREKGYAEGSSRREDYRYLNGLIRDKCPDIVIANTTGGTFGMPMEERVTALEALPEMASLNMGPSPVRFTLKKRPPPLVGRPEDVAFDGIDPFMPHPWSETELFARAMLEKKVKPELEIYNSGQFWLVYNLVDQGLVEPPYFLQFVMGYQGGTYPTPKNTLFMAELAPQPCLLNIAGVGAAQLTLNTYAIIMGWHVRTGMEDNIYYRRAEKVRTNADLVLRIVRIARELNREIATPSQAREMLGIPKSPRRYN
jgi:3-keto-5-aminohexanoate cleavage enzyme